MSRKSSIKLKVLTLNCWGLLEPISKFRKERIQAVADRIATGEFDLVLLQEIWVRKDYETLCQATLNKLPYSHYFHSGLLGSGLCVFSKHAILETFLHQYSLGGLAHKVKHGDWFAGKAVGMAVLDCLGFKINVYVTHTHAAYTGASYAVHKTLQACELGEFVRLTSMNSDAVILGGDLNDKDYQLGFKLVSSLGNLQDAWTTQRAAYKDEEGHTSGFPVWPAKAVDSVENTGATGRIDYLLYRSNGGFDMTSDRCYVTMKRVENRDYYYSDHLGVAAELTLKRNITAMETASTSDRGSCLKEAAGIVEDGLSQAKRDRGFYLLSVLLCLAGLLLINWLPSVPLLWAVLELVRLGVTMCLAFCLWMAVMVYCQEVTALRTLQQDLQHHLAALSQPH